LTEIAAGIVRTRRSVLRQGLVLGAGAAAATGGLIAATGSPAAAAPPAGVQDSWRYCSKCKGLYYNGQQAGNGVCPAGGGHDPGLSGNYRLFHDFAADTLSQSGWRYCRKCHGLAFGQVTGVCPAPGRGHLFDTVNDFNYAPYTTQLSGAGQQIGWMHCKNCQGMHYALAIEQSRCPHGGNHVTTGSVNYYLDMDF
jgi:hypothetical protein